MPAESMNFFRVVNVRVVVNELETNGRFGYPRKRDTVRLLILLRLPTLMIICLKVIYCLLLVNVICNFILNDYVSR